ncbi:MAG: flagellin [Thermoguttaceae bacterium]|nr:flagellin [Thermoguttaceae bacterium]MDW8079865.1 flagellin [Thermoguttaceae bacterium]
MTRINTNVSSLTAQKTLARSNVSLQQALTRLSTGLRINAGKDDPAGLIASEMLRANIVSINRAITNSERASQMIATADSALNQIGNLLNDIRALVTEAANSGAMTPDQIAANQLQIDAALEAINRIAHTTAFQGRKLLDGSLDFIHTAGAVPTIEDIEINRANLGPAGQMTVEVDIRQAARQAEVLSASGVAKATTVLRFRAGTTVTFDDGGTIRVNARSLGDAEAGVTVRFVYGGDNGTLSAQYDPDNKQLVVTFYGDATTTAQVVSAINNLPEFQAEEVTAGTLADTDDGTTATTGYDQITITAAKEGPQYNNVRVSVVTRSGVGTPTAAYYADTKNLVITIDSTNDTSLSSIAAAINSLDEFNATASANGDGVVNGATADRQALASTGISGYLTSAFSPATNAVAVLKFAPSATFTFASGAKIDIKAANLSETENNVTISFVADSTPVGQEYAEYDPVGKTLKIHINNASQTTAANVVAAINALPEWQAFVVTAGAVNGAGADRNLSARTAQDQLTIKALLPGADYNGVTVRVVKASGLGSTPTASYDSDNKVLTITIDDTVATNLTAIDQAIDALPEFSSSHRSYGAGRVRGNSADVDATANTGTSGGNVLLDDLVFQLRGPRGSEIFSFQAGTSVNQVVQAINLLTDSTGVRATQKEGLLTLRTLDYGSEATIDIDIVSEGADGQFDAALSAKRATGSDIVATVNGVIAQASGNTFSVNTSTLDLSITVQAGSSTDFSFTITGGGALFQLGPEIMGTQQARLGIGAVNTTSLRGKSGRLYELGSGQAAALAKDPARAARIVDEVINKVAGLRGRLGAFQKATIDTNISSLQDTVERLTEAESAIRDADFAAETAALTRAQILVQAGTAVLAIANTQPQNVLALLR